MSVLAVPRSVRITGYVLAVALALAAALANGMFAHSPGYAATTVPVHISQTPSKDASFPLENAVASGELYAFTLPVVGVERISFWLDAEPGTAEPVSRTDGRWGALNGVDEKGAVKPVNTDKLAHGRHLLVVRALFEDGSVNRTDVEFRVVHKPVLFVSQSPDRSDPVRLDGTTLTGRVYIFASAGEEASRVAFWRDDLAMAGRQARIEKTAPFDLKGGTTTQADPWATQQSPNGEHSVAVKVTTPDGVLTAAATFAVKNPPKLPKPAPSTATAAPTAGAPTASVPVVTPKPTATTSPKPTPRDSEADEQLADRGATAAARSAFGRQAERRLHRGAAGRVTDTVRFGHRDQGRHSAAEPRRRRCHRDRRGRRDRAERPGHDGHDLVRNLCAEGFLPRSHRPRRHPAAHKLLLERRCRGR